MERREFILKTSMSCAALTGLSFLFTECKTTSTIHETYNEISFPTSYLKGKNNLLVTSTKRQEKILVVKHPDGTYHALEMKCTHKGAGLEQKGDQLVCPSHGSMFDMEGNVVKSPAAKPLKKFSVTEKGSDLVINLS